jgi:uncharacterized protein YggE
MMTKGMIGTARPRKLVALLAMAMTLALMVGACTSDDEGDSNTALGALLRGLDAGQVEALARGASFSGGGFNSAVGINANGVSVVSAKPDIAVMSLGVEALALTVSEAREEAALAMNGMLTSLRAALVSDGDLETQFFNIQPEYTYEQVTTTLENGERISRSERRLIGYRVSNTLSVTIRDLDNIGAIVDGAVKAGGNATRLNGISFTLEDGGAAEANARIAALEDAVAKADLYAEKTGVTRGKLVNIVETSGTRFPQVARAESLAFDGGASAPTSLIAGDLEVRVSVQVLFSID